MTTSVLKTINSGDLLDFENFITTHPIKVDLVYAKPAHPDNLFKTDIYRYDAKMWGHRELVEIVLEAANICFKKTGWIFEIKDCLRTVEAQNLMRETDIVKAHPHWLEEPGRLLSPPGRGGHPRGMAVDVILIDKEGVEIDMGTRFDFLTEDRQNNPAARNYTNFSKDESYNQKILSNRYVLEEAMMMAAKKAGRDLLPLPQEWWDFRFLPVYTNEYEPISDLNLPEEMRMTVL